jgi:hypothetical protein
MKLLRMLVVQWVWASIDVCCQLRKPQHQFSSGIVGKFVSRVDEETLLERLQVKRNLNADQLVFLDDKTFYINQNLMPYCSVDKLGR